MSSASKGSGELTYADGFGDAERRQLSLTLFAARRQLRSVSCAPTARKAQLKTLTGRAERAELRKALQMDTARLASLEAMPPMQAADMRSGCTNPVWYSPSVTFSLNDGGSAGGPCPAWPR